jgi:GT2 family glycosyltransferase
MEAFVKVGFLDERTFMYGEDLDLAWRAWKAEYRVRFYPTAKVTHRIGTSGRKDYSSWIQNYTIAILDFFQQRESRSVQIIVRIPITFGAMLRLPIWLILSALLPSKKSEAVSRIHGWRTSIELAWNS